MFHLCALILFVFNAVFSYFLITLRTLHFSPPCMLSFHMLSHHTFDYVCVITNRMISTLLKCFTIFHCFDVTLKITFKWAIETFCHCELILCVFGDFDLCLLHNHNLCIKMCSFINSDGIPLFSIHGSAANHPQTRHLPANFHLMQKKTIWYIFFCCILLSTRASN